MSLLRNKASGAVTVDMDSNSIEFQTLADLRDTTGVNTLWEEVGEQNLAAVTSRVLVGYEPGAAITAAMLVTIPRLPGRAGTITLAQFVANAPGIVGVTTNTRTITTQQVTVTGTSSPVRAVTVLTTLALITGVNAVAGQPATMAINSASFTGDGQIQINSVAGGTGIVDPGGLVLLTYTPA